MWYINFKSNCATLISKSYGNSRINIEKLEKEIEKKDEIIKHLFVSFVISTNPPHNDTIISVKDDRHNAVVMETKSNEVSDSITDIINAGKDIPTKNIMDDFDNLLKSIREKKHESYFKQKLTKAHNKKSNDTAIDDIFKYPCQTYLACSNLLSGWKLYTHCHWCETTIKAEPIC